MEACANARGLRYDAAADQRWLRAREPDGSISIARAVLELPKHPMSPPAAPEPELGTWIAIVQDIRVKAQAATTSDLGSPFAEPMELVSMQRMATGDAAFDHVFATFAKS